MKKFLCLLATLVLFGCASSNEYIEYSRQKAWEMPEAKPTQIERKAPTKEEKASEIRWRDDMDVRYIKKAVKENKLILLYFYTDWCPYCHKMVKETFLNDPIVTMVNRKFYAFRINVEDLSDQQIEMFGVEKVPMIIVLKPDKDPEKAQLFRLQGFQDGDITFMFLLGTLNQ
jgi:thioredoxin-related protein